MPSMNEMPANYRVYKNGAIFDKDKGRIVALKPELAVKNTQITKENTSEMAARRLERKREAIARGANAVVAEGGKFDGTDLDFVEAIAEAQAIKALNPDDPKSTDAARFLLQEAGLADKQAVASPVEQMSDLLQALASFAASIAPPSSFDIMSITSTGDDVIDGTVTAAQDSGQDSGGGEEAEKDSGG